MAALRMYREKIRYLSTSEVVQQRREIFKTLNGDAFFPLKRWPEDMRLMFWKKPIGDKQTFKLLLFCIGNGCSPELICPWIMLSQTWATPATAEKRARQVDFIMNNVDTKRHCWFYFDMDYGKMLHLNGLPKEKCKWWPAFTFCDSTAPLGATKWIKVNEQQCTVVTK